MSKTQFTAGPWHVTEYMSDYVIDGADGFDVCNVINNDDIDRHNANLIAAAPEMYAMLEKLSMQLTAINAHKAVDEIERLLAKARGEV